MASETSEKVVEKIHKNPLIDDRFKIRESPLTDAFNNSSVARGIFSWVVTIFSMVFVVMIANYLLKPEIYQSDLEFVQRGFAGFTYFVVQWLILNASVALITFPATKYHVVNRDSNYFTYQIWIFFNVMIISVLPVYTIVTYNFHHALSCATVMEQIRFLMKLVSYLVENEKKKSFYEKHSDEEVVKDAPTFKSFTYFMFAPTLIYRDEYPRTEKTNWKAVASYSAQIIGILFMAVLISKHQMYPRFDLIGKRPLTAEDLTGIILWCIAFSWFMGGCIGYLFLHCWLNIFAELMRFGDRLFYKDWISAVDAMDFLRTWNYLIHSWITEYLYKPVLRSTGSKPFGLFVVMALAGLIHDYVIDMVGKYFLLYETIFIPIMLFTTCWTQWMQNRKTHDGEKEKEPVKEVRKKSTGTNIGMFIAIAITNMLECLVITSEYYASRNCVRPESGWLSSPLVPKIFSCPSYDLF